MEKETARFEAMKIQKIIGLY